MIIGMIGSLTVNEKQFEKELEGDFLFATELAEWLVVKGVPFRESHSIVGKVVQLAEEKNVKLNGLTVKDLQEMNTIFDETALQVFTVQNALHRKKTYGSPNPDMVKDQIDKWKKKLP